MPLQSTAGAASYDAFGGGIPIVPNYIEDVFSTWIYTGNGTTQTINNDIDLSNKGGLVWVKARNSATNHFLFDTTRGALDEINTNTTDGEASLASSLTAFNSNGFSLGNAAGINVNAVTYASWTFRKQPKFFDVVSYTGTGANRTIAHNLGSVPGCILIKITNLSGNWQVYHRGLANTQYISLNTTSAAITDATRWNSTTPTDTTFSLGTNVNVNGAGYTYIAYIFAHDSVGFGPTNTDNAISCGSYTGNGLTAGPNITLGYEPQWLMIKNASGTGNWRIVDNVRGMPVGTADASLQANLLNSEASIDHVSPTATGFQVTTTSSEVNTLNATYLYMAIRRGPMRVPTTGTSVLSVKNYAATTTSASVTHDVTFDAEINANRIRTTVAKFLVVDTLRGINGTYVWTATAGGEGSYPAYWSRNGQRGMSAVSSFDGWWASDSGTQNHISYGLVRAPGFFDIVCDTGTGGAHTVTHNLKAIPGLMLRKSRSATSAWEVYCSALLNTEKLVLNTSAAKTTDTTAWNSTTPTSGVFTVGTGSTVNTSGATYVTYLFATCPGVSSVGSFTGTAATQVINCGFTSGARLVLIKSISAIGDWYIFDTTRGIVAGTDPYLLVNNNATAEVTTTDWIDPAASGFELSNSAGNLVNSSGVTYIYLAIS